MVTAVVLMNVNADWTSRIASDLSGMPGVCEVYSVAGNYDLVAVLRAKDNETLADLVSETIRKVPGVVRTETLIAFRRITSIALPPSRRASAQIPLFAKE